MSKYNGIAFAIVVLGLLGYWGWVDYLEANNSFTPSFQCREVGDSYLMGDYELECKTPVPKKYKECAEVGESSGPGPGTSRINGIKIPVNGWIFVCGENVVTYDYDKKKENIYPAKESGFKPQENGNTND